MKNFSCTDENISKYVLEQITREDSQLGDVRRHCGERQLPDIHVSAFDGKHLEVLAAASQARRAIEIGTLGGYSGICLLRGMGTAGHLDTFEMDPHHAEVSRENFDRVGLGSQVEIHVGPALENLEKISNKAPFDLVFIDADKVNYPNYLSWSIDRLKVGGMIVGDNTFAFGNIHKTHGIGDEALEAQVKALREFNEILATNGRFRTTILPTGEGMTVAVKIR